jgi:hypothetical protein
MSFTQGKAGVPGLSGLYPGIIPTIRDIASGATPFGGRCDVDLRSLQLVAIVAKKYGSVQLTDLNRNCAGDSGATCDGKTISVSPVHCVEKMSPPQGIDFGWIGGLGSPSKSASEKLLTFLSGVVPEGSRAETNCESAGYTNFSRFAATGCNHQHVDFLNSRGAPLRINAGSSVAPAPVAKFPALRDSFTIAYQSSAGTLQTENSSLQISNWGFALAPGTSPSIGYMPDGSWQMAYIGSDNSLWTVDSAGRIAHPAMVVAPGTSPSITVLPNGKWVIGFVGSDTLLRTIDSSYNLMNLGRSVAEKTSPSIAALPNSSWVIAFHGSNGKLSLETSSLQMSDYGIAMAPGSSPSVTGLSNGSFALSFVGSNTQLYVIANNQLSNFGHSIRPGTSPSVTALAGSEFVVAYVNSDCTVSAEKSTLQVSNYGKCMAENSSPSIRGVADGRWFIAFVTNTRVLQVLDNRPSLSNFNRPIAANTSPSMN